MYIFGSHLIDLVVSILGEPEKVYPFIKQTGFEGVYSDDNNFAVLEYDKAIARITNLSVEEISTRCGFCNASHFVRLFRQREGLTPSQFRTLRKEFRRMN